jgi:hypothetical protein
MLQLLGGVAVAGVVAAGTTAFTGAGVTPTTTGANSFVGGVATQQVYGATVSNVAYHFLDAPTNTQLDVVTITFANGNADTKTPLMVPSGGALNGATGFVCTPINGSHISTCTINAGSYDGTLASIAITVP